MSAFPPNDLPGPESDRLDDTDAVSGTASDPVESDVELEAIEPESISLEDPAPEILLTCPICSRDIAPDTSELGMGFSRPQMTPCDNCKWKGIAYAFDPLELEVNLAQTAMDDDATCVNHPQKRATATCAGTGDFVCALCTVELDGETFSVQYLDGAGKERTAKTFEKKLKRPDRVLLTLAAINLFCFPVNLVTLVLTLPYIVKSWRLHGKDPIYTDVVNRGNLFATTLIALLTAAIGLGVIIMYGSMMLGMSY